MFAISRRAISTSPSLEGAERFGRGPRGEGGGRESSSHAAGSGAGPPAGTTGTVTGTTAGLGPVAVGAATTGVGVVDLTLSTSGRGRPNAGSGVAGDLGGGTRRGAARAGSPIAEYAESVAPIAATNPRVRRSPQSG